MSAFKSRSCFVGRGAALSAPSVRASVFSKVLIRQHAEGVSLRMNSSRRKWVFARLYRDSRASASSFAVASLMLGYVPRESLHRFPLDGLA